MSEEKKSPSPGPEPSPGSKEKPASPTTESKTPASRPHVVVFDKVTKRFGEGADARVAIQDVSFTIEDLPDIGELITIVGPSGCGKSTLLRTIAALKPHYPP